MVLQVAIRDDVIVSLRWNFNLFSSNSLLLSRCWALARRLEMMIFHIDVADDIVVRQRVFPRSEVPGLFLGVISAILETFEFVVEI